MERLTLELLRVWGGSPDGVRHWIVAAKTAKRAVELIKSKPGGHCTSAARLRDYWSMTYNPDQLRMAAGHGEGVYEQVGPHYSTEYKPI